MFGADATGSARVRRLVLNRLWVMLGFSRLIIGFSKLRVLVRHGCGNASGAKFPACQGLLFGKGKVDGRE